MILAWHESRPKEEIPPEHLWDDSDGLEEWWERIEVKKDFSSGGSSVKDEDLVTNEYARTFKK